MFPKANANKPNSYLIPALMLFSAGALSAYTIYKKIQKLTNQQATQAVQKLFSIMKIYYPNCREKIILIYEAAGLIPLLIKEVKKTPPENSYNPDNVLPIAHSIIQTMFIQPTEGQNDDEYLEKLTERLKNAGLNTPTINKEKLQQLFSQELQLNNPMPDVNINTQNITNIRNTLNTFIKTQASSNTLISHGLYYLAQDLNAIFAHFGKRHFRQDNQYGIVEDTSGITDPELLSIARNRAQKGASITQRT